MNRIVGLAGALWATLGVTYLLGFAIWRLAPRAFDAYRIGLTVPQWWIAGAVCLFMAYTEGYRGFQQRFSPRTAARIRYLRDHPSPLRTALAPLFAMGYLQATRRTKIAAYGVSTMIAVFIVTLRFVDQPWRGIVDAGVVVGLGWGIFSLLWSVARALGRARFEVSPEVPGFERGQTMNHHIPHTAGCDDS